MDFGTIIASIRDSIRGLIGRAVLQSYKAASGGKPPVVALELPGGERHSDFEFLQQYGLASRPPKGSELVVLFPGGSHGVGLVVASRSPDADAPALEDGEQCLYSKFGQKVLLKSDGSIVLTPANGKRVRVESDLDVTGGVNAVGEVSAKCVDAPTGIVPTAAVHLSSHLHSNAIPGPSTPPTPGV